MPLPRTRSPSSTSARNRSGSVSSDRRVCRLRAGHSRRPARPPPSPPSAPLGRRASTARAPVGHRVIACSALQQARRRRPAQRAFALLRCSWRFHKLGREDSGRAPGARDRAAPLSVKPASAVHRRVETSTAPYRTRLRTRRRCSSSLLPERAASTISTSASSADTTFLSGSRSSCRPTVQAGCPTPSMPRARRSRRRSARTPSTSPMADRAARPEHRLPISPACGREASQTGRIWCGSTRVPSARRPAASRIFSTRAPPHFRYSQTMRSSPVMRRPTSARP